MCRLAAYIGSEDIAASTLLYDMPMSVERMAYAPRELLSGHVNVDGTGVAWWADGPSTPLRYITEKPPWSDPNLPTLAPTFRGSPVVVAVRSATPGLSHGTDHVAPSIRDPRKMYQRLFRTTEIDRYRDITSLVLEDARSMKKRLGVSSAR